jgi:hypothetical protein
VVWWETEGKGPLGIPRQRWRDNIKTDHQEKVWDGVDCIELAEDKNKWRAVVDRLKKKKKLGIS